MSFHVTVKGGPDDGRSFRVDGQSIVGRGPRCQIQLTDPSVAWEHAALQDQNGRLFLQNLSAAGIKQNGRSVSGELRLVDGDEIEVCATTSLRVEERIGAGRSLHLSPLVIGALVVLVGALAIGAVLWLRPAPTPPPPVTLDSWKTAYERLEERLEQWETDGRFPPEALTIFRDAWRLEMAFNDEEALQRYDALAAVLLTLPMPGGSYDADSIAEAASFEPDALKVLMDWPEPVFALDADHRTDEAMADGLVWFVRDRASKLRKKLRSQ